MDQGAIQINILIWASLFVVGLPFQTADAMVDGWNVDILWMKTFEIWLSCQSQLNAQYFLVYSFHATMRDAFSAEL